MATYRLCPKVELWMYLIAVSLQQLLSVGTDGLKEHNHLRPSFCEAERLKLNLEHLTKSFPELDSTDLPTKAGLASGAPKQRLGLNLTAGKFWQVTGWNEEPNCGSRAHEIPGLHTAVSRVLGSVTSAEQVQKVNDLVLAISLTTGFVPGSLTKETIPWRHRGHEIEPAGA
ncbi:UNVERIFIED_CONTAM: hypothetical protein Sindi_1780400 [Sesamum indicum]